MSNEDLDLFDNLSEHVETPEILTNSPKFLNKNKNSSVPKSNTIESKMIKEKRNSINAARLVSPISPIKKSNNIKNNKTIKNKAVILSNKNNISTKHHNEAINKNKLIQSTKMEKFKKMKSPLKLENKIRKSIKSGNINYNKKNILQTHTINTIIESKESPKKSKKEKNQKITKNNENEKIINKFDLSVKKEKLAENENKTFVSLKIKKCQITKNIDYDEKTELKKKKVNYLCNNDINKIYSKKSEELNYRKIRTNKLSSKKKDIIHKDRNLNDINKSCESKKHNFEIYLETNSNYNTNNKVINDNKKNIYINNCNTIKYQNKNKSVLIRNAINKTKCIKSDRSKKINNIKNNEENKNKNLEEAKMIQINKNINENKINKEKKNIEEKK